MTHSFKPLRPLPGEVARPPRPAPHEQMRFAIEQRLAAREEPA